MYWLLTIVDLAYASTRAINCFELSSTSPTIKVSIMTVSQISISLSARIYRFSMLRLSTFSTAIFILSVLSTTNLMLTQSSVVAEDAKVSADGLQGMRLVFSEDFENGRDKWETTDDASWYIHDEAGNKSFGLNKRKSAYEPKVRSPHNIALIKDVEAADFVLTFQVRSTKDTGNHRDCCVFFCHQDSEHFYYVHLGAKPDPASGQIMIVNGQPRRPLTDNKTEVPWDDKWHKVKLVRDSTVGTIEIYFDDMQKPHMTTNDKTFGKGRIGIGSFDDMNDFDDVRLYVK